MSPARIPALFRGDFVPSKNPANSGILWRWKTVTHSGDFVMQSNSIPIEVFGYNFAKIHR